MKSLQKIATFISNGTAEHKPAPLVSHRLKDTQANQEDAATLLIEQKMAVDAGKGVPLLVLVVSKEGRS